MQVLTFPTGRINTNCYLLQQGNKCVIVDIAYRCQQLVDYVNSNNLQVIAVLLTHGHFDHCGGVEQLKSGCNLDNVPVYVHQADVKMCHDAKNNWFRITCDNCFPTHNVYEGKLTIDNFTFDVLHTPGHTPGSVVYLLDDMMFSGDTLFYKSVGRTDFPQGDAQALAKSLQKLKELQIDYKIYAGHGPCTTLQTELNHNPYLN
jgi:glyoxylase-like metal-dependent hydrolase (beta-lactamase superfamily II)